MTAGFVYDPFGQPLNPASGVVDTSAVPVTRTGTGTTDGWAGVFQRGYEHTGGLSQTLMGARTYLPALGMFTDTDPVPGGNTTTYTYPQDPINCQDFSGLRLWDGATETTVGLRVAPRAKVRPRIRAEGPRDINPTEDDKCRRNIRNCAICPVTSFQAKSYADANRGYSGLNDDQYQAVRHIMWQAILTQRLGVDEARQWGEAHEGLDRSIDSAADRLNNATGRAVGICLTSQSTTYDAIESTRMMMDWGIYAVR